MPEDGRGRAARLQLQRLRPAWQCHGHEGPGVQRGPRDTWHVDGRAEGDGGQRGPSGGHSTSGLSHPHGGSAQPPPPAGLRGMGQRGCLPAPREHAAVSGQTGLPVWGRGVIGFSPRTTGLAGYLGRTLVPAGPRVTVIRQRPLCPAGSPGAALPGSCPNTTLGPRVSRAWAAGAPWRGQERGPGRAPGRALAVATGAQDRRAGGRETGERKPAWPLRTGPRRGSLHLAREGRFLTRREARPGGAGRRSKHPCEAGDSRPAGPF